MYMGWHALIPKGIPDKIISLFQAPYKKEDYTMAVCANLSDKVWVVKQRYLKRKERRNITLRLLRR